MQLGISLTHKVIPGTFPLVLKFALGKEGIYQSFPYENHSQFTKSSYQDRGPCYLHIPIFLLYLHSPLLLAGEKVCEDWFQYD